VSGGASPWRSFQVTAAAALATRRTRDDFLNHAAEQMYKQLAITADDIAEVIAFAVTRPRRMTLNKILVRPIAQP
jgi:NADP-dependent 3-hydroxy acid dehydrogenase YdfG